MRKLIKADSIRFVCLGVLTLLGETVITLSFSDNTANDFLGFSIAFLMSLGTILLIKRILKTWSAKNFRCKKTLTLAASLILAFTLFAVALFTVYEFSRYAAEVMLSLRDIFLPFLSISLVALLYTKNKNLFLKAALLLFLPTVVIIIGTFCFSAPFMSFKYLVPYKPLSLGFTDSFFSLFSVLTISALPILFFGRKLSGKTVTGIFLITFVLFTAITVNVIALFGSELAATLSYPYSSAVSTATLSEVFSRMDGFLYALSIFTCLIKISVCTGAGYYLLKTAVSKI